MFERKNTRQIHIGNVAIGGGAPISVQSMCNTKTTDTKATVAQIKALQNAGCDIVRVAVPDMEAAQNLGNIIKEINIPLVADIHFDYKLALEAIKQGISALRLNPGNIGGEEKVRAVVKAAKEAHIPIRIGVNAGSLDKKILAKYGEVTPEALVESALARATESWKSESEMNFAISACLSVSSQRNWMRMVSMGRGLTNT